MSEIILDFGSGNTCKNDKAYIKRMIDELCDIDNEKHEVIIKWQLFEKAGNNIPLDRDLFHFAYNYAGIMGYKTTASVFDEGSLSFLLKYDVPFIKIANNKKYYPLMDLIPFRIPIYTSYTNPVKKKDKYSQAEWVLQKALTEERKRSLYEREPPC